MTSDDPSSEIKFGINENKESDTSFRLNSHRAMCHRRVIRYRPRVHEEFAGNTGFSQGL